MPASARPAYYWAIGMVSKQTISPNGMPVRIFEILEDLTKQMAKELVECARRQIEANGTFTLALTGGNSPRGLYRMLGEAPCRAAIDWKRVKIFFGDERAVGPDHPDSNFGMTWKLWLENGPIPHKSIFRLEGEAADLDDAAICYAQILEREVPTNPSGVPILDLILLGLGADGHTASLFPGTAALAERERTVVANAVPQLDAMRLTLTYPTLNAAREVWFLAPGAAKAEPVAQILGYPGYRSGGEDLPAAGVRPDSGPALWWLDRASTPIEA